MHGIGFRTIFPYLPAKVIIFYLFFISYNYHEPWTRHYMLRLVYFSPFFTAAFIVEQLVLQTIYGLNKEILQFLSLNPAILIKSGFKSRVCYNGACTVQCLEFGTKIIHQLPQVLASKLTFGGKQKQKL